MLFNSLEFALFLALVFLLYWFLFNKNLKLQNLFIVVVSYIFYGWWDKSFLLLIAFTTLCSYLSGIAIADAKTRKRAKWINGGNIVLNLFILGVFKYYNFFLTSLQEGLSGFGIQPGWVTLNLILPVGISFYTFQALSYSIDVYKKKMEPTRDIVAFFAFVSFFPQLVAGPIERATHLLPQFERERTFDYGKAVDGLRQMLWGFFKKVVIADTCALKVNYAFENYTELPASSLWIGAILFTFQIYGDFSGYSDIAIGTAKLFGIDLMRNFNFPYFSRDIAEFWRRWHISLSTWFRDYIYIPLGGSRGSKWMSLRSTMIIFSVSGLWHGANWTYVLWGVYHGLLFIPLLLMGKNRSNTGTVAEGKKIPSIREIIQMTLTFAMVMFGWILFRADSVSQAVRYIGGMFNRSALSYPVGMLGLDTVLYPLLVIFILIEWLQRHRQHALQVDHLGWRPVRYACYLSLMVILFFFIGGEPATFIYFQF